MHVVAQSQQIAAKQRSLCFFRLVLEPGHSDTNKSAMAKTNSNFQDVAYTMNDAPATSSIVGRSLARRTLLNFTEQKSHKSIEIRTKSELTHKISSDNAVTVMNLNEAHQRFSVSCWPF